MCKESNFYPPKKNKKKKKIRDFFKVLKIQVFYVSKIQRVKNANGKKYIGMETWTKYSIEFFLKIKSIKARKL